MKQEIFRTGFYHSPHFDNSIIAQTVERLGWRDLCSSENQVADRAHFMKIYEALVAREVENAKLLPAARALRQSSGARLLHPGSPDDHLLADEAPVH